jgi:hypothetical protein
MSPEQARGDEIGLPVTCSRSVPRRFLCADRLLWVNLVVAVVEVILVATGALLLFRRKTAGRRMIAPTGSWWRCKV